MGGAEAVRPSGGNARRHWKRRRYRARPPYASHRTGPPRGAVAVRARWTEGRKAARRGRRSGALVQGVVPEPGGAGEGHRVESRGPDLGLLLSRLSTEAGVRHRSPRRLRDAVELAGVLRLRSGVPARAELRRSGTRGVAISRRGEAGRERLASGRRA